MGIREDVAAYAAEKLTTPIEVRDKKIVHDALWGTQLLYRHEVAVLNTPLLQRLRYIHQTGFTYLTYPTTRHSRFDHSLGVLHQAHRLISHLREKYADQQQGPEAFDDGMVWQLRLTALVHDCSHGPFSHTSEELYRLMDDMQELITEKNGEFEGASPSETLAALILASEAFKDFIDRLSGMYNLNVDVDDMIRRIHGKNKVSNSGYRTDVINGPFDADKLDYIFRDSHFSGLPLSVDIDRLWHSVEVQNIPAGTLRAAERDMKRLVINAAGVNALEQIVFARMGLTASVYHHHKVRAVDCMFKGVIDYCRENGIQLCGRSLNSAADFLYMTDLSFLAESENNPNEEVREMVGRIYNRQLLKRALVISMKSTQDDSNGSEVTASTLHKLPMLKKTPDGYRKLRDLAKAIWEGAGKPGRLEDLWVDFPEEPKMTDLSRTIVNTGTPEDPKFEPLQEFIPLEQWGKQYMLNKWRGHVFCRPEDADRVKVAARAVIEETYNVKLNEYATGLAHLA